MKVHCMFMLISCCNSLNYNFATKATKKKRHREANEKKNTYVYAIVSEPFEWMTVGSVKDFFLLRQVHYVERIIKHID